MRRVDLAEELQLTASGVTRLLDGLEAQDCVEKKSCSSDARVTYAALTETGRKKLKKASSSHIAGIEALFQERFTDEELDTLVELLGKASGRRRSNRDGLHRVVTRPHRMDRGSALFWVQERFS